MAAAMAGAPSTLPPTRRRINVSILALVIVVVGVASAVVWVASMLGRPTFPIPAGTDVTLPVSQWPYSIVYEFSWGAGGRLVGNWTATATTTVTLEPRASPLATSFYRFEEVGTSGTFNLTYASAGDHPDMVLSFVSQVPDSIHVVDTIQVVYPSTAA